MKLLKQISTTLLAVIGVLALVALMLPAMVKVERSIDIPRDSTRVYPLINDLREFNRWSPWARIDPATKYEFSDPSSGSGAWMSWSSENPNVGVGRMAIVSSIPDERVAMLLDFGPQGSAGAYLTLLPVNGGTRVTWGFEEDFGYNLVGRYFGLMLDGLIGAEYEKGLANLQALAVSD